MQLRLHELSIICEKQILHLYFLDAEDLNMWIISYIMIFQFLSITTRFHLTFAFYEYVYWN